MNQQIPETAALFELPITRVTSEEVVTKIEERILSGQTHQIAMVNLDLVQTSLRDEYVQRIIRECSMVLPEGAPMVWASSLLASPFKPCVTGTDLISALARLSAQQGYRIYLLCASAQGSELAARTLEEFCPGVPIVGFSSPDPVPMRGMEDEAVLQQIEDAHPDILIVALGSPKQEIWIHQHSSRLMVPVSIGVGEALDRIAGRSRPVPRWMRAAHLAWLSSLLSNWNALFQRFASDAVDGVFRIPLALAARRLQPRERREGCWKVEVQGTVRILSTPARLSGSVCAWLIHQANAASVASQTLVIDLSATTRAEADGMGGLLEARRILMAEGLWIWLTGISNPIRRVMQFSATAELFRIAATPAEAIRCTDAHSFATSMRQTGGLLPGPRHAPAVTPHPVARAS